MNIDPLHPNPWASPPAELLAGQRFVRLEYNVSQKTGSEDLSRAYNQYNPVIQKYRQRGITPIVIFTHRTYGEGDWTTNKNFNWAAMYQNPNSPEWTRWADGFVNLTRQVVAQYAGEGIYFQWGNESDAAPGAGSSIPMPAGNYGTMMRRAIAEAKKMDTGAKHIAAGMMTGSGNAVNYLLESGILGSVNFVAGHPYGQCPPSFPDFCIHGSVHDYLWQWKQINKPLIITEFSVLDQGDASPERVIQYAAGMVKSFKAYNVAGWCWYAVLQGMHNGWGALLPNGQVRTWNNKSILTETAHTGVVTPPTEPLDRPYLLEISGARYLRVEAGAGETPIILVQPNTPVIELGEKAKTVGDYIWRKFQVGDKIGWLAVESVRKGVMPRAKLLL